MPALLRNLDLKRQRLHNEAAEDIQKQLGAKRIAVDHITARKLFELLYLIWQHSQEETIFFHEELDGVDLDILAKRIHDETGIKADISSIVWGWHENNPRPQHNINLSGEDVKTKMELVKRIIDEMIVASKQRAKIKKSQ